MIQRKSRLEGQNEEGTSYVPLGVQTNVCKRLPKETTCLTIFQDQKVSGDAACMSALARLEFACRKKVLKPPGAAARKLPPLKLPSRQAAGQSDQEVISPSTRAAIKAAKDADAAEFMAPTLRKSTMQRIEEAERERQEAERLVSPCLLSTALACRDFASGHWTPSHRQLPIAF